MVAWFIPPEWLRSTDSPPRTILEAAHFTASLAAREDHHIAHSNIPLIIHQTWKNTQVDTWTESIAEGVEKWLTYATRGGNESMAYFLWLDEGCEGVVESEPSIRDMVEALPLKVEKSDVFRVLVLNLIGGVVSLPFFFLFLLSLGEQCEMAQRQLCSFTPLLFSPTLLSSVASPGVWGLAPIKKREGKRMTLRWPSGGDCRRGRPFSSSHSILTQPL
jgi:hypothetical protein